MKRRLFKEGGPLAKLCIESASDENQQVKGIDKFHVLSLNIDQANQIMEDELGPCLIRKVSSSSDLFAQEPIQSEQSKLGFFGKNAPLIASNTYIEQKPFHQKQGNTTSYLSQNVPSASEEGDYDIKIASLVQKC